MSLGFKAVLFECCEGGDPHPVQLLKDLTQDRSIKLLLYNTELTDEKASLYSVVFDIVINTETAMKYEKVADSRLPSSKVIARCLGDLDITPSETLALCTSAAGCVAASEANLGVIFCTNPKAAANAEMYKSLGCDNVITNDDFSLAQANDLFHYHAQNSTQNWHLTYHSFNPESELGRESLTTVANGYIGIRGSLDFSSHTPEVHYPGCYIAGVYNLSESIVEGQAVQNSDLVNCPNFNKLTLLIDGEVVSLIDCLVNYEHELNMFTATMSRKLTLRDKKNRLTRIEMERFASMHDPHICGSKIEITPINHSAEITLISDIDTEVENKGVPRYNNLNSHHLKTLRKGSLNPSTSFATVQTSGLGDPTFVSILSRHEALCDRVTNAATDGDNGRYQVTFSGSKLVLEKISAICTSKKAAFDAEAETKNLMHGKGSYNSIQSMHMRNWLSKWKLADISVEGDRNMRLCQRTARLNTYHSISSFSDNCIKFDVGLAARGLTGEGSRGHMFWDELFWFPSTLLFSPEAARAHIQYRINRLPQAMRHAEQHGFKGAMIPWQTSDTGNEVTQKVHYNPISKTWDPDKSSRQRHVGLAVFIDCFRFFRHTSDDSFLVSGGLGKLMLEICRFFVSCATLEGDHYHIRNVMGPDEYHENSNQNTNGVNNNAYTNVLTSFILNAMLELLKLNPILKHTCNVTTEELTLWADISRRLKICFIDEAAGTLEQFDGWSKLKKFDHESYRKRYTSEQLQRLDRVLKAEGKRPDDYQIVKQPDTLMIFYVLSSEEVSQTFNRLGYGHTLLCLDPISALRSNYDYYNPQTTSGSALTYTVHAKLSNKLKRQSAQAKWLRQSLSGDLFSQRSADGTVQEGVHIGVMSGTIDFLINDIVGMSVDGRVVQFTPDLPPGCDRIQFRRIVKGCVINVSVSRSKVSVLLESQPSEKSQLSMRVRSTQVKLEPWSKVTVRYALSTNSEFHTLMRRSRVIRADIVQAVFDCQHVTPNQVDSLKELRDFLKTVPTLDNKSILYVDNMVWGSYATDLSLEIDELDRDILFLENEQNCFKKIRSEHADWDRVVEQGREWVNKLPDNLTFIFSRDNATMRNTKFLSSIQPVYNSVALTRFAKSRCSTSTYITASPLGGEASARKIPVEANGVFDVCVNPLNTYNYSGSNGRVFVSANELTGSFPFPKGASSSELDDFNARVVHLLRTDRFKKFLSFGKGFQQKWGETIITLDDPYIEIPKSEKRNLGTAVQQLLSDVDVHRVLVFEETASYLRISDSRIKNYETFTKADGLQFLNKPLGLNLAQNPSLLVCGSMADLQMVKAVPNPSVIIVGMPDVPAPPGITNALRVPTTDHLLGILNASSDAKRWPVKVTTSRL
eukprot:TRINITY_DN4134_c2_g1_i1.p1 TRINITY_DN4134_c2_g1~~TRINITY_DN4134_c2_g1_i1.p1  ORF type:complete len:1395 (+),score=212.48 TRINITY_DN4134_c2_g1_i1:80-4186(+)